MTVPSETNRSGPYNGNGSTTVFSYGFRIVDEDHLRVILTSALGVETILTIDADYIVSDVGDPAGGQIALTVAPATGETITILRNIPFVQETDLENQGAYYAETVEDALDLAAMRDQQLSEEVERAIKVPASYDGGADLDLPTPEASKFIAWNEAADGLRNADAAELVSVAAYGTARSDIFEGDGVETEFSLSVSPAALNNLDVAIGGVTQLPGVDYTWSSGTTITFTSPPADGVKVLVRYMQALPQGEVLLEDVQGLDEALAAKAPATFTQASGSGSRARTLDERLQDSISIFDKADVTTSDFTAAFNACLATGRTIRLPSRGVPFVVTDTISWQNADIVGEGWDAEVVADFADASKPLFRPGRSVLLENFACRFADARITGSETQGQRVLLDTYGGPSGYELQRGSAVRNMLFGKSGTGIYSPSSPEKPAFSVEFANLEFVDQSYAFMDMKSETRTGNVYSNLYGKSSYTMEFGFAIDGEESELTGTQLNVEHTAFRTAALILRGARAMGFGSVHIEGVDVVNSGKQYVLIENSAGSIGVLTMYWTRMSADNTALVRFGSTDYDDFGGLVDPDNMNWIRFGALHLKGIADPNAGLYPTYPANRRGLNSTIVGAVAFARPAIYASRDLWVDVEKYVYNTNPTLSDESWYQSLPDDGNNNIAYIRKGVRRVNGEQFNGPQFMVGQDNDNPHPMLIDRNGHSYLPVLARWFDDQTGIGFPAAGEMCVTLSNGEKVRFKSGSVGPSFDDALDLGLLTNRWKSAHIKDAHLYPAASITPSTNGELVIQATSNTSLTFKFKGSDGTVRSGSITLS